MLTTEQCRKILGDDVQISDERLERLRDELYALADLVTDDLANGDVEAESAVGGGFDAALALLPEGDREEAAERAAIMEFDGGAAADEAERAAVLAAIQRRRGNGDEA